MRSVTACGDEVTALRCPVDASARPARRVALLLPVASRRGRSCSGNLGVEVRARAVGLERVFQFVNERDARADAELRDPGAADAVEVLDRRTEGVAVRYCARLGQREHVPPIIRRQHLLDGAVERSKPRAG